MCGSIGLPASYREALIHPRRPSRRAYNRRINPGQGGGCWCADLTALAPTLYADWNHRLDLCRKPGHCRSLERPASWSRLCSGRGACAPSRALFRALAEHFGVWI